MHDGFAMPGTRKIFNLFYCSKMLLLWCRTHHQIFKFKTGFKTKARNLSKLSLHISIENLLPVWVWLVVMSLGEQLAEVLILFSVVVEL